MDCIGGGFFGGWFVYLWLMFLVGIVMYVEYWYEGIELYLVCVVFWGWCVCSEIVGVYVLLYCIDVDGV